MRRPQRTLGVSRRAQRLRSGAAVIVAGACALTLLVAAHRSAAAHARGTFRIAGSVSGLYPGISTHLFLTVTNPQAYAIKVTQIRTSVGSPSAACGASNLVVGTFTGHRVVARHGKAVVTVPISLRHAAPDACQGAVFPLTYTGTARKH